MADVSARSKWLFWTMISAVFLFTVVPSAFLIEKSRDYYRFLTGWNPGTLRATESRGIPHRSQAPPRDSVDIHFVEFSLPGPSAKTVNLAAGFSGWRARQIALRKENDGTWRTVVPLPSGTYRYAFEVDGAWTLDPSAKEKGVWSGKEVSIRRVP